VIAGLRATSVTRALARLQLLAFSRGNYGVGPFPRCLANLTNSLALLLLAEICLLHTARISERVLSWMLLRCSMTFLEIPACSQQGSVFWVAGPFAAVGSLRGAGCCAPPEISANKVAERMTKMNVLRRMDTPDALS